MTPLTDDVMNQAIGRSIQAGTVQTNYVDIGAGDPVILVHGSGVGVSCQHSVLVCQHSRF